MRVLIIKTSSMGDVIHTLPALTDAARAIPGISFDWVVEESFAEIPAWHPCVNKVIPMALRRWRKNLASAKTWREYYAFYKALRAERYDLIIDAQSLVKSAVISLLAKGKRGGLDWSSARESFASVFYQKKCTVNFRQHAIVRMRSIFSELLRYQVLDPVPDYGINRQRFQSETENYLVFLHGTTWNTKLWPEEYWQQLVKFAEKKGLSVLLTAGNTLELERANRIAAVSPLVTVLANLKILDVAKLLANAKAVVSLDTGFAHLAAALEVPNVSLFGPTNPTFTGTLGKSQICLGANFPCAPCQSRTCSYQGASEVKPACFATLTPALVWNQVTKLI